MPVVTSTYKAPIGFRNGFVSTVYSGLIRRVNGLYQTRERITLSDGDFLDLDWSYAEKPTNKLIILLHGLEGDAQRPYITGTAKLFNTYGYDALSVNFRGCSGEDNLLYRSYHSGETGDLKQVIDHALEKDIYSELYISGYSLGGNVTLKYLGEEPQIPNQIKGAVAISVPVYLQGSCIELHKLKNKPYAIRFLRHLIGRLRLKQQRFPEMITKAEIRQIKTLKDFDDAYTSKAHGFKDADDYYEQSSSLQFLPGIKVPTLLINALNDSFLSPECFPVKEAKENPQLFLEMPKHGGHVGFHDRRNLYYNEARSLEFLGGL
ncbi:MAG: alpha/beta fold hydrolase [Bacteroidota bacterium]